VRTILTAPSRNNLTYSLTYLSAMFRYESIRQTQTAVSIRNRDRADLLLPQQSSEPSWHKTIVQSTPQTTLTGELQWDDKLTVWGTQCVSSLDKPSRPKRTRTHHQPSIFITGASDSEFSDPPGSGSIPDPETLNPTGHWWNKTEIKTDSDTLVLHWAEKEKLLINLLCN